MSEPDFAELQRLWQAPPSAAASAAPIILRQRRRRWLSRLYLGSEIVMTIVAIPFSLGVMLQPEGFAIGLGCILFTLFAASASFWARSVRSTSFEDPLLASIDEGVRRARIGVRLAYSTLWALIAAMIFIAVLGLVWWSTPDVSPAAARRMIFAFAIWFTFVGVFTGATLAYLAIRSRELTQMLHVRDALHRQL